MQPSEIAQFVLNPGYVPGHVFFNFMFSSTDTEANNTPSATNGEGQSARAEAADDAAVRSGGQSRLGSLLAQLIGRPDGHAVDSPVEFLAVPTAALAPSTEPAVPLPPYHTSTFPPGRDLPGFVPFGRKSQASAHQGNHWPIEPELRGEIVHAEVDNFRRRPEHQRLTYREILNKYSEWNPVEGVKKGVVSSTLRGYNRRYTIPDKKNRVRVPQWHGQHLRALRKAVPRATGHGGKVSWKAVRDSVKAATGRPFGLATLSAKWSELQGKGEDEGSGDSCGEETEDGDDLSVEDPDDEPGLDENLRGRKWDGDEDKDEDGCGGAMQAPAGTVRHSQLATAC